MSTKRKIKRIKDLSDLMTDETFNVKNMRVSVVLSSKDGLYHSVRTHSRDKDAVSTVFLGEFLKNTCPTCLDSPWVRLPERPYWTTVGKIFALKEYLNRFLSKDPGPSILRTFNLLVEIENFLRVIKADRSYRSPYYTAPAAIAKRMDLISALGWSKNIEEMLKTRRDEILKLGQSLNDIPLRKRFVPAHIRFSVSGIMTPTPAYTQLRKDADKFYAEYIKSDRKYLAFLSSTPSWGLLSVVDTVLVQLYAYGHGEERIIIAPAAIIEHLGRKEIDDMALLDGATAKEIETTLVLCNPEGRGSHINLEAALEVAKNLEQGE